MDHPGDALTTPLPSTDGEYARFQALVREATDRVAPLRPAVYRANL